MYGHVTVHVTKTKKYMNQTMSQHKINVLAKNMYEEFSSKGMYCDTTCVSI